MPEYFSAFGENTIFVVPIQLIEKRPFSLAVSAVIILRV
jgi:hypothetical protein